MSFKINETVFKGVMSDLDDTFQTALAILDSYLQTLVQLGVSDANKLSGIMPVKGEGEIKAAPYNQEFYRVLTKMAHSLRTLDKTSPGHFIKNVEKFTTEAIDELLKKSGHFYSDAYVDVLNMLMSLQSQARLSIQKLSQTATAPVIPLPLSSTGPCLEVRIPGDGNCMFKSIEKGLEIYGISASDLPHDTDGLRQFVAKEMGREEFRPFLKEILKADIKDVNIISVCFSVDMAEKIRYFRNLLAENFGKNSELSKLDEEIDTYLEKEGIDAYLAALHDPSVWGGFAELEILSRKFNLCFEMYMPNRADQPVKVIGTAAGNNVIALCAYGRHFNLRVHQSHENKLLQLVDRESLVYFNATEFSGNVIPISASGLGYSADRTESSNTSLSLLKFFQELLQSESHSSVAESKGEASHADPVKTDSSANKKSKISLRGRERFPIGTKLVGNVSASPDLRTSTMLKNLRKIEVNQTAPGMSTSVPFFSDTKPEDKSLAGRKVHDVPVSAPVGSEKLLSHYLGPKKVPFKPVEAALLIINLIDAFQNDPSYDTLPGEFLLLPTTSPIPTARHFEVKFPKETMPSSGNATDDIFRVGEVLARVLLNRPDFSIRDLAGLKKKSPFLAQVVYACLEGVEKHGHKERQRLQFLDGVKNLLRYFVDKTSANEQPEKLLDDIFRLDYPNTPMIPRDQNGVIPFGADAEAVSAATAEFNKEVLYNQSYSELFLSGGEVTGKSLYLKRMALNYAGNAYVVQLDESSYGLTDALPAFLGKLDDVFQQFLLSRNTSTRTKREELRQRFREAFGDKLADFCAYMPKLAAFLKYKADLNRTPVLPLDHPVVRRCLLSFIECISLSKPLILILDDVHRAAPAIAVILRLIMSYRPDNVGIVAAYRDDRKPSFPGTHGVSGVVRLRGLTENDFETLVRETMRWGSKDLNKDEKRMVRRLFGKGNCLSGPALLEAYNKLALITAYSGMPQLPKELAKQLHIGVSQLRIARLKNEYPYFSLVKGKEATAVELNTAAFKEIGKKEGVSSFGLRHCELLPGLTRFLKEYPEGAGLLAAIRFVTGGTAESANEEGLVRVLQRSEFALNEVAVKLLLSKAVEAELLTKMSVHGRVCYGLRQVWIGEKACDHLEAQIKSPEEMAVFKMVIAFHYDAQDRFGPERIRLLKDVKLITASGVDPELIARACECYSPARGVAVHQDTLKKAITDWVTDVISFCMKWYDYDQALIYWNDLLTLRKTLTPQQAFDRIQCAFKAGHFKVTKEWIELFLKAEQKNADEPVKLMMSELYSIRGDIQLAEDHVAEALQSWEQGMMLWYPKFEFPKDEKSAKNKIGLKWGGEKLPGQSILQKLDNELFILWQHYYKTPFSLALSEKPDLDQRIRSEIATRLGVAAEQEPELLSMVINRACLVSSKKSLSHEALIDELDKNPKLLDDHFPAAIQWVRQNSAIVTLLNKWITTTFMNLQYFRSFCVALDAADLSCLEEKFLKGAMLFFLDVSSFIVGMNFNKVPLAAKLYKRIGEIAEQLQDVAADEWLHLTHEGLQGPVFQTITGPEFHLAQQKGWNAALVSGNDVCVGVNGVINSYYAKYKGMSLDRVLSELDVYQTHIFATPYALRFGLMAENYYIPVRALYYTKSERQALAKTPSVFAAKLDEELLGQKGKPESKGALGVWIESKGKSAPKEFSDLLHLILPQRYGAAKVTFKSEQDIRRYMEVQPYDVKKMVYFHFVNQDGLGDLACAMAEDSYFMEDWETVIDIFKRYVDQKLDGQKTSQENGIRMLFYYGMAESFRAVSGSKTGSEKPKGYDSLMNKGHNYAYANLGEGTPSPVFALKHWDKKNQEAVGWDGKLSFHHLYHALLAAEAAVNGEVEKAVFLMSAAIDSAEKHGFLPDAAQFRVLRAILFSSAGWPDVFHETDMRCALESFIALRAMGKIEQLKQDHKALMPAETSPEIMAMSAVLSSPENEETGLGNLLNFLIRGTGAFGAYIVTTKENFSVLMSKEIDTKVAFSEVLISQIMTVTELTVWSPKDDSGHCWVITPFLTYTLVLRYSVQLSFDEENISTTVRVLAGSAEKGLVRLKLNSGYSAEDIAQRKLALESLGSAVPSGKAPNEDVMGCLLNAEQMFLKNMIQNGLIELKKAVDLSRQYPALHFVVCEKAAKLLKTTGDELIKAGNSLIAEVQEKYKAAEKGAEGEKEVKLKKGERRKLRSQLAGGEGQCALGKMFLGLSGVYAEKAIQLANSLADIKKFIQSKELQREFAPLLPDAVSVSELIPFEPEAMSRTLAQIYANPDKGAARPFIIGEVQRCLLQLGSEQEEVILRRTILSLPPDEENLSGANILFDTGSLRRRDTFYVNQPAQEGVISLRLIERCLRSGLQVLLYPAGYFPADAYLAKLDTRPEAVAVIRFGRYVVYLEARTANAFEALAGEWMVLKGDMTYFLQLLSQYGGMPGPDTSQEGAKTISRESSRSSLQQDEPGVIDSFAMLEDKLPEGIRGIFNRYRDLLQEKAPWDAILVQFSALFYALSNRVENTATSFKDKAVLLDALRCVFYEFYCYQKFGKKPENLKGLTFELNVSRYQLELEKNDIEKLYRTDVLLKYCTQLQRVGVKVLKQFADSLKDVKKPERVKELVMQFCRLGVDVVAVEGIALVLRAAIRYKLLPSVCFNHHEGQPFIHSVIECCINESNFGGIPDQTRTVLELLVTGAKANNELTELLKPVDRERRTVLMLAVTKHTHLASYILEVTANLPGLQAYLLSVRSSSGYKAFDALAKLTIDTIKACIQNETDSMYRDMEKVMARFGYSQVTLLEKQVRLMEQVLRAISDETAFGQPVNSSFTLAGAGSVKNGTVLKSIETVRSLLTYAEKSRRTFEDKKEDFSANPFDALLRLKLKGNKEYGGALAKLAEGLKCYNAEFYGQLIQEYDEIEKVCGNDPRKFTKAIKEFLETFKKKDVDLFTYFESLIYRVVCRQPDAKTRAAMIEIFIDLAECSSGLSDHQTAFTIVNSLTTSIFTPLLGGGKSPGKQVSPLSEAAGKSLEKLKTLYSHQGNYKAYRVCESAVADQHNAVPVFSVSLVKDVTMSGETIFTSSADLEAALLKEKEANPQEVGTIRDSIKLLENRIEQARELIRKGLARFKGMLVTDTDPFGLSLGRAVFSLYPVVLSEDERSDLVKETMEPGYKLLTALLREPAMDVLARTKRTGSERAYKAQLALFGDALSCHFSERIGQLLTGWKNTIMSVQETNMMVYLLRTRPEKPDSLALLQPLRVLLPSEAKAVSDEKAKEPEVPLEVALAEAAGRWDAALLAFTILRNGLNPDGWSNEWPNREWTAFGQKKIDAVKVMVAATTETKDGAVIKNALACLELLSGKFEEFDAFRRSLSKNEVSALYRLFVDMRTPVNGQVEMIRKALSDYITVCLNEIDKTQWTALIHLTAPGDSQDPKDRKYGFLPLVLGRPVSSEKDTFSAEDKGKASVCLRRRIGIMSAENCIRILCGKMDPAAIADFLDPKLVVENGPAADILDDLNLMAYALVYSILMDSSDLTDLKHRVEMLFDLSGIFKEQRHYSLFFAVGAALNLTVTSRVLNGLQQFPALAPLSDQQSKTLVEVTKVCSPLGNYKGYVAEVGHLDATQSVVPLLPLLTQQLTFIADGNPTMVETEINQQKQSLYASTILPVLNRFNPVSPRYEEKLKHIALRTVQEWQHELSSYTGEKKSEEKMQQFALRRGNALEDLLLRRFSEISKQLNSPDLGKKSKAQREVWVFPPAKPVSLEISPLPKTGAVVLPEMTDFDNEITTLMTLSKTPSFVGGDEFRARINRLVLSLKTMPGTPMILAEHFCRIYECVRSIMAGCYRDIMVEDVFDFERARTWLSKVEVLRQDILVPVFRSYLDIFEAVGRQVFDSAYHFMRFRIAGLEPQDVRAVFIAAVKAGFFDAAMKMANDKSFKVFDNPDRKEDMALFGWAVRGRKPEIVKVILESNTNRVRLYALLTQLWTLGENERDWTALHWTLLCPGMLSAVTEVLTSTSNTFLLLHLLHSRDSMVEHTPIEKALSYLNRNLNLENRAESTVATAELKKQYASAISQWSQVVAEFMGVTATLSGWRTLLTIEGARVSLPEIEKKDKKKAQLVASLSKKMEQIRQTAAQDTNLAQYEMQIAELVKLVRKTGVKLLNVTVPVLELKSFRRQDAWDKLLENYLKTLVKSKSEEEIETMFKPDEDKDFGGQRDLGPSDYSPETNPKSSGLKESRDESGSEYDSVTESGPTDSMGMKRSDSRSSLESGENSLGNTPGSTPGTLSPVSSPLLSRKQSGFRSDIHFRAASAATIPDFPEEPRDFSEEEGHDFQLALQLSLKHSSAKAEKSVKKTEGPGRSQILFNDLRQIDQTYVLKSAKHTLAVLHRLCKELQTVVEKDDRFWKLADQWLPLAIIDCNMFLRKSVNSPVVDLLETIGDSHYLKQSCSALLTLEEGKSLSEEGFIKTMMKRLEELMTILKPVYSVDMSFEKEVTAAKSLKETYEKKLGFVKGDGSCGYRSIARIVMMAVKRNDYSLIAEGLFASLWNEVLQEISSEINNKTFADWIAARYAHFHDGQLPKVVDGAVVLAVIRCASVKSDVQLLEWMLVRLLRKAEAALLRRYTDTPLNENSDSELDRAVYNVVMTRVIIDLTSKQSKNEEIDITAYLKSNWAAAVETTVSYVSETLSRMETIDYGLFAQLLQISFICEIWAVKKDSGTFGKNTTIDHICKTPRSTGTVLIADNHYYYLKQ